MIKVWTQGHRRSGRTRQQMLWFPSAYQSVGLRLSLVHRRLFVEFVAVNVEIRIFRFKKMWMPRFVFWKRWQQGMQSYVKTGSQTRFPVGKKERHTVSQSPYPTLVSLSSVTLRQKNMVPRPEVDNECGVAESGERNEVWVRYCVNPYAYILWATGNSSL